MRAKNKLVQGVGVNDASYAVRVRVANGWDMCPYYMRWSAMLARCYSPTALKKQPTYAGCSVAEEWLTFSAFRKWMEAQCWEGMQLDKDFLIPGNKIYSPDACIFIPHRLNVVLTARERSRGLYPLGVHKEGQGYKSQCSDYTRGGSTYLGAYDSPEEAHRAWQVDKIKQIRAALTAWQNPDPRAVVCVNRICERIQADIDAERETISFKA